MPLGMPIALLSPCSEPINIHPVWIARPQFPVLSIDFPRLLKKKQEQPPWKGRLLAISQSL